MSSPSVEEAPLPTAGTEVWLEDLPIGPVPTVVLELEDGLLRLDPPRIGGRDVRIPPGRELGVTYRHRDAPCRLPVVLAGPPHGGAAGLWTRVTGPAVRNQRRDHVRVDMAMPAEVQVAMDSPQGTPGSLLAGTTENVSATGLLIRATAELPLGTTVELLLRAPGRAQPALAAAATVVRRVPPSERGAPWGLALRVDRMERDAQRQLQEILLERQRELRRRELGFE